MDGEIVRLRPLCHTSWYSDSFLISKKSKVRTANLVAALLEIITPITTEPESDDAEDDVP